MFIVCGTDMTPGDFGPGNFTCDGFDVPKLISYNCEPLGTECEQEGCLHVGEVGNPFSRLEREQQHG